jgi:O-acetyl-ADP-ribose deacetylase (regulator of RNase III)
MVRLVHGNILKAEADALVNTVNTVGVMGKGIAYQFKQAYPENTRLYEEACKHDSVIIGRMFVTYTGQLEPRVIINFPTKRHWKGNSKIADIRAGLMDLVKIVQDLQVSSIAIPPLGCGLGGLRWEDVRPMIEDAFASLHSVEVLLYEPGVVIRSEDRIINTPKPDLNLWRAALIKIVGSYRALGYEASHLEAQKLVYFLKEAGVDLKSNFVKGTYGPYDRGMEYGIKTMDGHYILGFGDGERLEPVRLALNAEYEADNFLKEHPETIRKINNVSDLIEGFESPYGLELLATLHWVNHYDNGDHVNSAIDRVHDWNPRKRRIMKEDHLRVAWQRLDQQGWLRKNS